MRIQETASQQTLETKLRRDVVVGVGAAESGVKEPVQLASAHVFDGAHGAQTQPIDVAQVDFGQGVAKVGVHHLGRIKNVHALVPLTPHAQGVGVDGDNGHAHHVGVVERIARGL